ncbi:MAG: hypothetical protein KJN76_03170 [Eudoraea sp.]|nr:hypothetical protein [Eudoraea sp.]
MKNKNSLWYGIIVLMLTIGCGESRKKEAPDTEEATVEAVDEAAMKAAQIAEDSLQQIKIADSIKQDSLRQVEEHGHVH